MLNRKKCKPTYSNEEIGALLHFCLTIKTIFGELANDMVSGEISTFLDGIGTVQSVYLEW